jgi:beta-glucanase (GH16 family)
MSDAVLAAIAARESGSTSAGVTKIVAVITLTPDTINAGEATVIAGTGFPARRKATVTINGYTVATPDTSSTGTFSVSVTPTVGPGTWLVRAQCRNVKSEITLTVNSATTEPPPEPIAGYTFFDDFDAIDATIWAGHYNFGGIENTWATDHVTVSGSILSLTATRTSPGVWVSGHLDTKYVSLSHPGFVQLYGLFEANIKIPKGRGLWPAFWGYYDANSAEIDTMEICANPIGERSGNDASLLHTTVHWSTGSSGHATRAVDLSLDYHVYGVDWRADHISFTLDGVEVWRFTDTAHIPTVALPLILNLAVGGSWCGPSDGTTPSPATMLVDWVRVSA